MNKTELVEAIAKTAGLTKADADRAVKAGIEAITKSLKKGDAVHFLNLNIVCRENTSFISIKL